MRVMSFMDDDYDEHEHNDDDDDADCFYSKDEQKWMSAINAR